MTHNLALEYVEIDLPYCSLTYGVAPCQATLTGSPPTGTIKCFNTRATCQDLANIAIVPTTVRFARQTEYLPQDDIEALPYLESVDYNPAVVSLGENLGQRAELKFILSDHPHSDTGAGFDKYYSERTYDPYSLGTIFGKLRSRYPSLRGVAVRWVMGFLDQTLAQMETRHFFIESFNGPSPDGKFEIIAKDVLKFLDGDRALAPLPSAGYLVADITEEETSFSITPTGALDAYPTTGYAALGGNEVVEYAKDEAAGITSNTKLLLHFDGVDGSTTFTDSSGTGKTTTAIGGNAQLDTEFKRFGTASYKGDGTGDYFDYLDNADWTPAGDFTIDLRARFNALGANQTFCTHTQDGNNFYQFGILSTGSVFFTIFSGGVEILDFESPTGQFVTGQWYHIAVVRSGTVWTFYKDGVAIDTTTDSVTIPNFGGGFRIGANNAGASSVNGWLDEFSFHHAARWTADFIPPGPYSSTTSSGRVTVRRAQLNTTASDHSAQDRFQLVLRYVDDSPADIISDLITNYTDTPVGYIPLTEWQTECDTYLNRVYSFNITEPTPVSQLISELIVQAALAMWDNNVEQQIHLQVIRGVALDSEVYDESNIINGSFKNTDQPERRVSQVLVYYGQIDPTKKVDDDNNYRSTYHTTDADSELAYGASIRKVHARGIAAAGLSVAQRLGDLVIARYKVPPRKFSVGIMRNSTVFTPIVGAGKNIEFWNLQDATGAGETVPTQIIRLKPDPAQFSIDLEEMRIDAPASDLANRQITISSNTNNINLRTVHDSIYPPVVGGMSPAEQITCTIAEDVIVGSTSNSIPSFDVGSWPAGVNISLIVLGRLEGKGGDGGLGGNGSFTPAGAGGAGGTALYTRYAITLTDTNGEIWGGGGGGGGGQLSAGNSSGGGGGAGQTPGLGNTGFPADTNRGGDGTTEAGGIGATAGGDGGNGGGPGLAGTAGQTTLLPGGAGGAAGNAVDGISFVTTSGAAGDRRGGTIN